MDFWGVKVKAGKCLKVELQLGRIIHISQAARGKVKKDEEESDLIPLYVKINGKKILMASLSSKTCPQTTFDLAFTKDFELSHAAKNGLIYFSGYSIAAPSLYPLSLKAHILKKMQHTHIPRISLRMMKLRLMHEEAKPEASMGKFHKLQSSIKPKVTPPEAKKEDPDDKAESSKKRSKGLAEEAVVSAKKAKMVTPQKKEKKYTFEIGDIFEKELYEERVVCSLGFASTTRHEITPSMLKRVVKPSKELDPLMLYAKSHDHFE